MKGEPVDTDAWSNVPWGTLACTMADVDDLLNEQLPGLYNAKLRETLVDIIKHHGTGPRVPLAVRCQNPWQVAVVARLANMTGINLEGKEGGGG